MKTKKIPMRMCVVTREKLPKYELIRVVKNTNGDIIVDETSKANGKGAYLKKDLSVIKIAKEKKILNRVLECDIPDKIYSDLENIIGE